MLQRRPKLIGNFVPHRLDIAPGMIGREGAGDHRGDERMMQRELQRVLDTPNLSKGTFEMATRSIA